MQTLLCCRYQTAFFTILVSVSMLMLERQSFWYRTVLARRMFSWWTSANWTLQIHSSMTARRVVCHTSTRVMSHPEVTSYHRRPQMVMAPLIETILWTEVYMEAWMRTLEVPWVRNMQMKVAGRLLPFYQASILHLALQRLLMFPAASFSRMVLHLVCPCPEWEARVPASHHQQLLTLTFAMRTAPADVRGTTVTFTSTVVCWTSCTLSCVTLRSILPTGNHECWMARSRQMTATAIVLSSSPSSYSDKYVWICCVLLSWPVNLSVYKQHWNMFVLKLKCHVVKAWRLTCQLRDERIQCSHQIQFTFVFSCHELKWSCLTTDLYLHASNKNFVITKI